MVYNKRHGEGMNHRLAREEKMSKKNNVTLFNDSTKLSVIAAVMSTATIAVDEYPTGEFTKKDPAKEGGRISYVAVTHPRQVLKFQTAVGTDARGRGSFSVPIEDASLALNALQGIDIDGFETETEEEWLSVTEAIGRTARRFADEDGEEYIGFRTRLGKGSKEIKIPVADWPQFVGETLPAIVNVAEKKVSQLDEKQAAKKKG
jgi:hypothetical protein